jgi:putative heme-binding domain-containing protein
VLNPLDSHPERRFSVKAVLLLALACAFAAPAQIPVRNPHSTAEDSAAGAKIFRSHCASCHGVKGTGGLGPNLTTGTFLHGGADADLYRNISEGIVGTAMPGVFFDGTQVWQIVAFVRSLRQTGSAAPVHGDAVHGGKLFREKGCAGCHLVRGEGGVKGPDLSVIGSQRSPEHFRESILDPNAKVAPQFWMAKIVARDGTSYSGFLLNQDTYMVQILDFSRGLQSLPRTSFRDFGIDRSSAMPSYKGKLSESELNDLVSYLASLKEKPE